MDASWVSEFKFHPLVGEWFYGQYEHPTEVQRQAWERISRGEHVLISAPTGTGKTLAAFLWSLNQLITGRLPVGHTSVLYVSPLKALNNDVRRNLMEPLAGLHRTFAEAELPFPDIQVLTRSGDSTAAERRRIVKHPPEILITTPESLNLLLTSKGGRGILSSIRSVVLDEIHAVVSNKRGVHLITAVDRLVLLAGEFQRIALSATVKPMQRVAQFVGGSRRTGIGADCRCHPREVAVVDSRVEKQYQVSVLPCLMSRADPTAAWEPVVNELRRIIESNRSTLVFVNGRRLCESLTARINSGLGEAIAYAHHGSLARETRQEVESQLKAGKLQAIVATSSLELGIDVGAVDQAVLVQSPPSVSSAVQRVGRSGHQVGVPSRAVFVPTHARDLLELTVLAGCVVDHRFEDSASVDAPLDVLAQIIVSMVAAETWDTDELYHHIRCSYPYRDLTRRQFAVVLEMLGGRYADTRIRELKARVSVDRADGTVAAVRGAEQAIYASGGTIPDRGYFQLRHARNNARLGELDEEFVWENRVGARFSLGGGSWRIERITHSDVFAAPTAQPGSAPFWKGEGMNRAFHLSEQLGLFLEQANAHLADPDFEQSMSSEHHLDPEAAQDLTEYLRQQARESRADLPHRHHLLTEHIQSGPQGVPGEQLALHTLWGGRINRPYAIALAASWEREFGHAVECYPTNDCVYVMNPEDVTAPEVLGLVTSENVGDLLREHLESSGLFAARFRECAGRALLLGRGRPGQRVPLWMNRLRAQKLLGAVLEYEDFPVLLETWRTCLRDEFDMDNLRRVLDELAAGEIRHSEATTLTGSPFAGADSWRRVNEYMYMGDRVDGATRSRTAVDLVEESVLTPHLRAQVPPELVREFEEKLQRLSPGYAPRDARAVVDWVRERVLLPHDEWAGLIEAVSRDADPSPEDMGGFLEARLCLVRPTGSGQDLVCALDDVAVMLGTLWRETECEVRRLDGQETLAAPRPAESDDPLQRGADLVHQWLRFYGPRSSRFAAESLGISSELHARVAENLTARRLIVTGELVEGSPDQFVCDGENLAAILRMRRSRAARPAAALPADMLQLFLAQQGGLCDRAGGEDAFHRQLERMVCCSAPAGLWEPDILPARVAEYSPDWLDRAMAGGELQWLGSGRERITFCMGDDAVLLTPADPAAQAQPDIALADLWADPEGRYPFTSLLEAGDLSAAELSERLWQAAWRGEVSSDTFLAVRKGIETGFDWVEPENRGGRGGPTWRRHRRRRAAFPGNWYRVAPSPGPPDPIALDEDRKERVRILVGRYGILFRELLLREEPPFQWSALFRAMRLMELSGELVAGYFFEGIPGPQFAPPATVAALQQPLDTEAAYWLNAADPLSLAGVALTEGRGRLPRRHPTTHFAACGPEILMHSERQGAELTFRISPDDPRLEHCVGVLNHLLRRRVNPLSRIEVSRINGAPASSSPFAEWLRDSFETIADWDKLVLLRH